MDHISRFPDGVLHHILSFLPTKDVLRTSILSKRWKLVLDTYPILDFSWGDCAEQSSDAMYSENASDEYRQMLTKFMNYVDTSIFRFCKYKFSMQKFKLFLVLPDLELSSHLDKWVQKVIENGAKEVDFGIDLPGYLHFKKPYSMPDAIFAAKSVTVLKLFGCNVKLEESFCIKLHSLQKLALKEVQMDDHLLRRIVTCCPLIEDISLRFCWGFKKIQVFELLRLKKFEIYSHLSKPESVEIKSPSLESFHCSFTVRSVKPIVSVDACQGLKSLILSGSFVTELLLQDLVPKFHVLESLRVGDCPVLKKVKISSWRLKSLEIHSCENIMDIEINTPNLLSCKYCGSVVPVSLINAPSCHWQVEFSLTNTLDILWYMTLKEFLAKLNQLVYLHVYVYLTTIMSSLNLEDLSNNASPYVVDNVVLTVHSASPIMTYANFMDGLFFFSRPKNLFIRSTDEQKRYVEYLCGFSKRALSCCNHRKVKCWRHDLKEVKLGSFVESADGMVDYNRMTSSFFWLVKGHTHCKMEWEL